MAIAEDHEAAHPFAFHRLILVVGHVGGNLISHVEQVMRTELHEPRLVRRAFSHALEGTDGVANPLALILETFDFATFLGDDLGNLFGRHALEQTMRVELRLGRSFTVQPATRGDVEAITTSATASVLAPPADVEGGCIALTVDALMVRRFGIVRPTVLGNGHLHILRVFILESEFDEIFSGLSSQELDLLDEAAYGTSKTLLLGSRAGNEGCNVVATNHRNAFPRIDTAHH